MLSVVSSVVGVVSPSISLEVLLVDSVAVPDSEVSLEEVVSVVVSVELSVVLS